MARENFSIRALYNITMYVAPVCRLNIGIQVPINIIISLNRENYLIITIIRLIIIHKNLV